MVNGDDGVWTNIIQQKNKYMLKKKKKPLWKILRRWLNGSRLRSKWHTVLPLSHIPSVSRLSHTYTQTEERQSDFSSSRRRVSWKQKHLRDADKRRLFPKKDLSESTNNLRLKWNPWHKCGCVVACLHWWKKVHHMQVFSAYLRVEIGQTVLSLYKCWVSNTNERPTAWSIWQMEQMNSVVGVTPIK